ncbi:unnamed protein product [Brachionus calyciflorus]|uniref:Uncharacterized protein n=1 Tax=Brachionus calyciflorus TaxID=104777 RepID=A0A814GR80_9BILA|nr:unnamed protein product [Brachionus calyciflorus]
MENEIKLKMMIIKTDKTEIIKNDIGLIYKEVDQKKILRTSDEMNFFEFQNIISCDGVIFLYIQVKGATISLLFQDKEDCSKLNQWLIVKIKYNKTNDVSEKLIEESFSVELRKNPDIGFDSKEFLKKEILKLINDYTNGLFYYAPYTMVCQSSGFGKSRACLSLKDEFYIVYCCLRDVSSTGYPKQSALASYLLQTNNYQIKFKCYFNFFIDILNEKSNDLSCIDFFEAYGKQENSKSLRMSNLINEKLLQSNENMSLSEYSGTKPLIFIFDEASIMLSDSYYTMRSVLTDLKTNIFVLFLDTFSNLSLFMPATYRDPSQRISRQEKKVFEPIYLLPNWDVFKNESRIKNIYDTILFKNICSFGRVLWGSWFYTKHNSNNQYESISDVELLKLAIEKLIFGKSETEPFDQNDCLAILSCRIGVIKPKLMSTSQILVAKNMAVCTFVDIEKNIFEIDYP